MMDAPKILSPVTSFEGAVEVITAGADEVYCAVRIPGAVHLLNRSEFCCVPTYDELGRISGYAHSKGVEVIVTLELPFISEFMASQMREHISSCVREGIDALIVGDIGLIMTIHDTRLDIPIYASTLLGAMNYRAVSFIRELGVKRMILERHVGVQDIREVVRHHQDLDVEVFVHGQGCSNINVNCYLESGLAPPSALQKVTTGIKGMATPCRWPFDVYELGDYESGDGERKIARAPVLDAFSFCSLCRLPELIETGVSGLKIVGRCMPLLYQVKATEMYRTLVNLLKRSSRSGFNRAQWRRYDRIVESIKEAPSQPQIQQPDGSWSSSLRHVDVVCREGRCYYSPFFHVPYGSSDS